MYAEITRNPLLHLCLSEPLRLGKAHILRENDEGMLIYCPEGRFHCLAAADIHAARSLLADADDPGFIMLLNADFAPVLDGFDLPHRMRCRQAAWLKDELPEADTDLTIAPPDDRGFARILETYHMDTPEELQRRRQRGEIFFARSPCGEDAGFVGLHPEGCFGLLHIFPGQRGRGYGAALQRHIIRFCMEHGRIPYCQVDEDNLPSMNLQHRLGMSVTPETLLMAWRDEF